MKMAAERGWFCFVCDMWHLPGTLCAIARLRGAKVCEQKDYDEWCKEHQADLKKMMEDGSERER